MIYWHSFLLFIYTETEGGVCEMSEQEKIRLTALSTKAG